MQSPRNSNGNLPNDRLPSPSEVQKFLERVDRQTNAQHKSGIADWCAAALFTLLIGSGAVTAGACVVLPLLWMPYPSNLVGAVVGLAILAVVLGVLKFLCGGILEILVVLGIVGLMVALISPSVREERDRARKSAEPPAATAADAPVVPMTN